MTDEDLYVLRVETIAEHRQLLQITGTRETVIEVALRVMLDSAGPWNARLRPMFQVDVYKVTA